MNLNEKIFGVISKISCGKDKKQKNYDEGKLQGRIS